MGPQVTRSFCSSEEQLYTACGVAGDHAHWRGIVKMDGYVMDSLEKSGVHPKRVIVRGNHPPRPRGSSEFVLYWMNGAYRSQWNECLAFSQAIAETKELPLIVLITIDLEHFRRGSIRHLRFFLEGLRDIEASFREANVDYEVRIEPSSAVHHKAGYLNILGDPESGVTGFAEFAHLVVTERQFCTHQRMANEKVEELIDCMLLEVDCTCAIPTKVAAPNGPIHDEQEFIENYFAAAMEYCSPIYHVPVKGDSKSMVPVCNLGWSISEETFDEHRRDEDAFRNLLYENGIDLSVPLITNYSLGGFDVKAEITFLLKKLENDSCIEYGSLGGKHLLHGTRLSAYLSFGFISAPQVFHELVADPSKASNISKLLATSFATRELALHWWNTKYEFNSYLTLIPSDVRKKLEKFCLGRSREVKHYTIPQWEMAATDDPLWNEAEEELLLTGQIVESSRIAWCQTLLEISHDAERAYNIASYLSRKYMLDDLDPSSRRLLAACFADANVPEVRDTSPKGKEACLTDFEFIRNVRLHMWPLREATDRSILL